MFRRILVIIMFGVAAGLSGVVGLGPLAAQQAPNAARTFDQQSPNPGDQVKVTIAAEGYGTLGAIEERLPDGLEYDSLETGGVLVADEGRTVKFALTTPDTVTFTYIVNVLDSATVGRRTFMGTLTGAGNVAGTFPDSSIMVAAAPASVPNATRTFDQQSPNPGDQVKVTIAAEGYGTLGAIEERLPDGLEYDSLETGSVLVDVENRTVKFALTTPDTVTFTYIVNVLDSATVGRRTFMGTLTGAGNVAGTFPDSSIMVAAAPASVPNATRTFDQRNPNPGDQVKVTIAAEGYGTLGAIEERLPDGFEYDSLETGSVLVAVEGRTVKFALTTPDTVTFTYIVNVLDSATVGRRTFMGTLTGAGNIAGTFPDSSITVRSSSPPPARPAPRPTPANNPPAFSDDAVTRSVAENTATGANVGAAVTATDPDGDTLTYALSGDDEMYFTINNMGQIKVGADAMLDYETKETYMVTVTATDSQMATDTIDVTIMVTDVDERDPLVIKYDTNGIEGIQRNEVIAAIRDYLNGVADAPPGTG